jgi:hypothetical protein
MKTSAATAYEVEAVERQAWQNMFDIAPEEFRKRVKLFYRNVGGGTCQVFPNYPIVHFNMVLGLGFTEPLTDTLLREVENIYAAAGQPAYMVQFCHEIQEALPQDLFAAMNYHCAGTWERVVWWPQYVAPVVTTRNLTVKKITAGTAATWQKFIIDHYHYPVDGWLEAFVTHRWHHFVAIEDETIVACRSIFVNNENKAWSGIEAPVPMIMTDDLIPDFILWKHIQQFCLEQNCCMIAADIEQPSPQRNTPVYSLFDALGFEVTYARKLYRKK